jgi:hypothetical protein
MLPNLQKIDSIDGQRIQQLKKYHTRTDNLNGNNQYHFIFLFNTCSY